MAVDYTDLAKQLIKDTGGKENIKRVFHCVTRLRFEVKDKSLVNDQNIKSAEGVLGTVWAGDQYQVIIGSTVGDAYDAVCKEGGFEKNDEVPEDEPDKTPAQKPEKFSDKVSAFMKPLVDSVIPLMGLFISTGLIKGILSACAVFGWISTDSSTYMYIYAIGDALFYFFPIFIGFTAGKVFHTNTFMTAAIGAVLVYPTITAAVTAKTATTLFGIPVASVNYASSILPVFFAALIASKIYPFFEKHTPKSLKYMLPIALTLIIVVPVTFLVIGPIMTFIANVIGSGISYVWNAVPVIGGFLIGGLWQLLVMTGLHTGMTPLILQLLNQYGYDILGGCVTCSMIALAGAALAMAVCSKETRRRETAASAAISALLGVTEPAIYAVALPYLKAFGSVIVSGGIGGALAAVLGVKVYGFGGSSLLQLPFTFSPDGITNTLYWLICVGVTLIVSFVLTTLVCRKDFSKK